MSKKKPVVALIYDFDGTLSPLNMQEYDFLKAIGIKNKTAFWKENNELIKQHEASNILCYMKLMIDKAHAARVSIKREQFVEFGKSIELYKGVEEWFDLINQIGKKEGVIIHHYINSSGLKEMIEGTKISKKFMINKGISSICDNYKINQYVEESDRPIPFKHMIYFGDGETDIPCMKLIKQQGGNSIAVYKPRNTKKKQCAEKLVKDRRVNFACAADYSKGGEIYNIVESIIKQIKSNYDFSLLEMKNQRKFGKEE